VAPEANVSYTDPQAVVLYTDLQVQFSYLDPAASFVYTDPRAVLQYVDAAASVLWTEVTATEVRFDPFLLLRTLAETVGFAETVVVIRGVFFSFTDNYGVSDSAVLAVTKVISDGVFLDDTLSSDGVVSVEKSNLVTTADVITFAAASVRADSLSFTELVALTTGKQLLDVATISDTLLAELSYVPTAIVNGGPLNTFALNE
jgi:hypothetical protein